MKKNLLLFITLAVVFFYAAPTQAAWCHTFTTNLGFAQSGSDEVGELHTLLQQRGIPYGQDTGNFYGPDTATAVQILQNQVGILATGFFGNLTRAWANTTYGCSTNSEPDYSDTLLVVNDNSPNVSVAIGNYFLRQRPTFNGNRVVHITSPTTEAITENEFANTIKVPIENFITANNLTSQINYIILTKGVSLVISDSGHSVDSELAACLGKTGCSSGGTQNNPFYFSHNRFSHQQYNMYLVTRLDGYAPLGDLSQIKALIDHSSTSGLPSIATIKANGVFVLDGGGAYDSSLNPMLVAANQLLLAKGFKTVFDLGSTYITGKKNVAGYISWGSNASIDPSVPAHAIPQNTYLNGAIGETAVSTSGRSFSYPPSYGQSLIADWIGEGISGIKGYVSEPGSSAIAHPDILFDHYTSGYNMAESYYAASPYINGEDIIIGDPKMAITSLAPLSISAINGQCGTSNGQSFVGPPPSINLCVTGTFSSYYISSNIFSWRCLGSNGGTTAQCNAQYFDDNIGICGNSNNKTFILPPTLNLCQSGRASSIYHDTVKGLWEWNCGLTTIAYCIADDGVPVSSIKLLSPNGGENWKVGETHDIIWNTFNLMDNYIGIDLNSTDKLTGQPDTTTIVNGGFFTGKYSWKIPEWITSSSTNFKIVVVGSDPIGKAIQGNSNYFNIEANPGPSITLTSPNNGESLIASQNITVSWTSSNMLEGDTLEISLNDYTSPFNQITYNIVSGLSANNLQNYNYTIPPTMTPGSGYVIRAKVLRNGHLMTYADRYVSIIKPPPPSITVLTPNGSEILTQKQTYTITYKSTSLASGTPLRINLFDGAIGKYSLIANVTASSLGSYTWTVPDTSVGNNFKIQIVNPANTTPGDLSDTYFTIKAYPPTCNSLHQCVGGATPGAGCDVNSDCKPILPSPTPIPTQSPSIQPPLTNFDQQINLLASLISKIRELLNLKP